MNFTSTHENMNVRKHILICDDNELIREALRVFLSDNPDFLLDFSEDGKSGLEKLKKNDYDLVIMDLQMPFLSGTEVIRMLREGDNDQTPIIVLTGHLTDQVLKNTLEKYAVESILTKPFSPAQLMDEIAKVFQTNAATATFK